MEKAIAKPKGESKNEPKSEIAAMQKEIVKSLKSKSALSAQLSTMMGDAPFCSDCGHTTVRNGSCYRCLNCGNSMGCS